MLTKVDGTVWYMGWNTFGTFGNGTYANAIIPTKNLTINILDTPQKSKKILAMLTIKSQRKNGRKSIYKLI